MKIDESGRTHWLLRRRKRRIEEMEDDEKDRLKKDLDEAHQERLQLHHQVLDLVDKIKKKLEEDAEMRSVYHRSKNIAMEDQ